jgi:hypothetical protein
MKEKRKKKPNFTATAKIVTPSKFNINEFCTPNLTKKKKNQIHNPKGL